MHIHVCNIKYHMSACTCTHCTGRTLFKFIILSLLFYYYTLGERELERKLVREKESGREWDREMNGERIERERGMGGVCVCVCVRDREGERESHRGHFAGKARGKRRYMYQP